MRRPSEIGLARTVKAAVVRNNLSSVFATRLKRAQKSARALVIASPWITGSAAGLQPLNTIAKAIQTHRIPTYVFTRSPQTQSHQDALQTLAACPSTEIVLNEQLHAKIYACLAPYPYGFALLGSANLTDGSKSMHEIGLMIMSGGSGETTIKELAAFGIDYLRTRPESAVLKRMSLRR